MKTYNKNFEVEKEAARQEAIEWQVAASEANYSMGELAEFEKHFRELGEKYNLLNEFTENGIIGNEEYELKDKYSLVVRYAMTKAGIDNHNVAVVGNEDNRIFLVVNGTENYTIRLWESSPNWVRYSLFKMEGNSGNPIIESDTYYFA